MANIRILGLNDDNHSPSFISEDGTYFSHAIDLMNMLCKPHENTYEIKMFAIVEEWSEQLETYDEEMVLHMFNFLEDISIIPEGMTFEEIFNMFWESANTNWW